MIALRNNLGKDGYLPCLVVSNQADGYEKTLSAQTSEAVASRSCPLGSVSADRHVRAPMEEEERRRSGVPALRTLGVDQLKEQLV